MPIIGVGGYGNSTQMAGICPRHMSVNSLTCGMVVMDIVTNNRLSQTEYTLEGCRNWRKRFLDCVVCSRH